MRVGYCRFAAPEAVFAALDAELPMLRRILGISNSLKAYHNIKLVVVTERISKSHERENIVASCYEVLEQALEKVRLDDAG